ncbi:MAG: hypothetical protein Q8Q09_15805 [Deltaproteobacteria bacterium]|nr:hypothetical protein [Deltaproteobacteria bacterium]
MIEIKGQVITPFIEVLRESKRWDAVEPKLSESCRTSIARRPLASEWVEATPFFELLRVVYETYGQQVTVDGGYASTKLSIGRFTMPLTQSMLRLFGATPWTLFSRLGPMSTQSTRGLKLEATQIGTHAVVVVMIYDTKERLPIGALYHSAGSLMTVFDLIPFEGKVESVEWTNREENQGKIKISWVETKR